jgi:hypothetical protein
MPLVDLKTNLKSLKYGRDRLNGGSSREPFISKDIEGLRLSDLHRTGGSDLLIRGGFLLPGRIADDEIRLGKYFTTTEGVLWAATQNVLSRGAVKLQAGRRGYGSFSSAKDQLAGVKELTSLTLSGGLGSNGLGGVDANLRNDVNPLNQGTYTPLSTLLAVAGNPFGGHPNKQGLDPTGLTSLSLITYSDLVKKDQPETQNRLANLYRNKIQESTTDPVLFNYSGGPGSDLGYGKTTIYLSDQRTGENLASKQYWEDKIISTVFSSNLIEITSKGVSSVYGVTTEENKISDGDGLRTEFVSNVKPLFYKSTPINPGKLVDRTSALGLDDLEGERIIDKYTKGYKKEYKVNSSPEFKLTNIPFDFPIPNPDRRFDDPNYRDEYLDQAKTEGVSSKQSSPLAPSNFIPPTPNDNGVDGNNTISEQGNPTTPTRKSYATPPTTTLQGATGAYDASNPTYGNILNTTPSPTTQIQNAIDSGNDATLSKGELNLAAKDTKNSRTIIDFRRRVKKKNTKEAQKNGALTDSLNWDGNVSKQIETRVKLGDPGSPSIDRSDYTKGGGPARTGVDKINSLYLYKADNVSGDGQKKNDLVKFRIATIDPDNPSKKTFAHFRAFLNGMSDEYGAGWNSFKYMGRGEEFYNYEGFTRNISLGWTVAAQSKEELSIQYQKLNYLASTLAPNYSKAGFMRGNIHQLTVGAYFYECPGVITSLNFTIPDESPWEIAIPTNPSQTSNVSAGVSSDKSVKELPHMIQVQMSFKPIHNFLPQTVGSSYDTSNPNGILGGKAISQRFISLENASSTGTNDLYSDGIPDWAKI